MSEHYALDDHLAERTLLAGHVDPDEAVDRAAVREAWEEGGVVSQPDDVVPHERLVLEGMRDGTVPAIVSLPSGTLTGTTPATGVRPA